MDMLPLSGGGAMSPGWMPMCGQSWLGAAASFLGMWTAMMAGMMLPSLLPVLWRHRRTRGGAGEVPSAMLTALVAGGYFVAWALLGAVIYPLGAATLAASMRYPVLARLMPAASGLVVLLAGALQLTRWKARQLACCRSAACVASPVGGCGLPLAACTAGRDGLRLGLRCIRCCAGLTAALIAVGLMSWPAMLAATAAINLERLVPAGERVARLVGVMVIAAGLVLGARAIGL
jgi:predicted metal-binding membrane protein